MFRLGCQTRICAQNEILSGLTVALALVPEAVAFAFVAGVDPLVGLYAAFMVGLLASIFGGRPGMISGATGAMAVVMVALVADHGVEYLFAAVVVTGLLQMLAGILKLGKVYSNRTASRNARVCKWTGNRYFSGSNSTFSN